MSHLLANKYVKLGLINKMILAPYVHIPNRHRFKCLNKGCDKCCFLLEENCLVADKLVSEEQLTEFREKHPELFI